MKSIFSLLLLFVSIISSGQIVSEKVGYEKLTYKCYHCGKVKTETKFDFFNIRNEEIQKEATAEWMLSRMLGGVETETKCHGSRDGEHTYNLDSKTMQYKTFKVDLAKARKEASAIKKEKEQEEAANMKRQDAEQEEGKIAEKEQQELYNSAVRKGKEEKAQLAENASKERNEILALEVAKNYDAALKRWRYFIDNYDYAYRTPDDYYHCMRCQLMTSKAKEYPKLLDYADRYRELIRTEIQIGKRDNFSKEDSMKVELVEAHMKFLNFHNWEDKSTRKFWVPKYAEIYKKFLGEKIGDTPWEVVVKQDLQHFLTMNEYQASKKAIKEELDLLYGD